MSRPELLDEPIPLDWTEWHFAVLEDGRAVIAGSNGAWSLDRPAGRERAKGRAADLESAKRAALGADSDRATWRRSASANISAVVGHIVQEEDDGSFLWRVTVWITEEVAAGHAATMEEAQAAAETARRQNLRISPRLRAHHEQDRGEEAEAPGFSKPPGVKPASRVFGVLLRRLRTQAGKLAWQLADHLGVAYSYLYDVEEGKREPLPAEEIDDVACFLGIEAEVLHLAAETSRPRPVASAQA